MGATGGGVWKTEDAGVSWENISDGYFDTPSIGAISVSKSNTDIVYVGTGSDGLRSNVITGKGVLKSIDAGKTWQHIGLRNVGQIGAVEIHPGNPDIVYVAAIGQAFQANEERGVYRTLDGGKNWKKVLKRRRRYLQIYRWWRILDTTNEWFTYRFNWKNRLGDFCG